MNKIICIALSALLFPLCVPADAKQAKTVPRIGYLTLGSRPTEPEVAFKQELRKLGWVEGQNIIIESRWAGNDMNRLPALSKELVDLKVDVIVASATPAIQAAKNATATIPIVMSGAADPVGIGFVASLARPGGNITGVVPPVSRACRQEVGAAQGSCSKAHSCGVNGSWGRSSP